VLAVAAARRVNTQEVELGIALWKTELHIDLSEICARRRQRTQINVTRALALRKKQDNRKTQLDFK
jgi:hypothetical protein